MIYVVIYCVLVHRNSLHFIEKLQDGNVYDETDKYYMVTIKSLKRS